LYGQFSEEGVGKMLVRQHLEIDWAVLEELVSARERRGQKCLPGLIPLGNGTEVFREKHFAIFEVADEYRAPDECVRVWNREARGDQPRAYRRQVPNEGMVGSVPEPEPVVLKQVPGFDLVSAIFLQLGLNLGRRADKVKEPLLSLGLIDIP